LSLEPKELAVLPDNSGLTVTLQICDSHYTHVIHITNTWFTLHIRDSCLITQV